MELSVQRIEIEAYEDRTFPGGGHAVLVLHGAPQLPDNPVFRLKPLEEMPARELPFDWLDHDHLPVSTFETSAGPALVIGPEIASSGLLVAGSAVAIVLPQAGLHGEFKWPALTSHTQARRLGLLSSPVRPARSVTPGTGIAPTARAHATATAACITATATAIQQAMRQAMEPTMALATAGAMQRLQPPARRPGRDAHSPTFQAPTSFWSTADPRPQDGFVFVIDESAMPVHQSLPPASAVASAAEYHPAPLAEPAPRRSTSPLVVALAAALSMLGLLTCGMVVLDLKLVPAKMVSAASIGQMPQTPSLPPPAVKAGLGLYDLLASGATSPEGVDARGISPAKALQMASARLRSKAGTRDAEEAAFWLKRYLATTFGAEGTRVALTQLGSAHADNAGTPADFDKARLAWELAGALGDPVALCFLGALHSQGLGVNPNQQIASEWYRRAIAAGGNCPTPR